MLNTKWTDTIFYVCAVLWDILQKTALTEREPTKLYENK